MFKVKSILLPKFAFNPSFSLRPRRAGIKWNTLIIDELSLERGKTNISAFRPTRHKITFSNYAAQVFFSTIEGPISLSVSPGHEQTSNWEIILPLPEFSEFATFWAAKENEKWEFTENSFGAISRDFQPHPTDRPSFKTVKTKRAIFALIIHVVNDYDSFGINCRGNLWKFFGSDQNHQNQPLWRLSCICGYHIIITVTSASNTSALFC